MNHNPTDKFAKGHPFYPIVNPGKSYNPVPLITRPTFILARLKAIINDPKSKVKDILEAARIHETIEARVRLQQIEVSKGKTRDQLSQSSPLKKPKEKKIQEIIAKLQQEEKAV